MKNENVYYKIGYFTGYILQIILYLGVGWGIFTAIKNHEFPYLPLILIFSYYTFKKSISILEYVKNPIIFNDSETLTEEDIVRIINNVNYWYSRGAGPN